MYELNMVLSKELVGNTDLCKRFIELIELIGVKKVSVEFNDGSVQEMTCEECCVEDSDIELIDIIETIQLPLAK